MIELKDVTGQKFQILSKLDDDIVNKEKAKIVLIDTVAKLNDELDLIKSEIMVNINSEKLGDKPIYSNDKAREAELNRRLKEHKTYNETKDSYIQFVRSRHMIDIEIDSLKRKWEMMMVI